MIKVKVLSLFNDLEADKVRIKDEVFSVSKKRFKEINSTSHGELVVKVEENKLDLEMENNE